MNKTRYIALCIMAFVTGFYLEEVFVRILLVILP